MSMRDIQFFREILCPSIYTSLSLLPVSRCSVPHLMCVSDHQSASDETPSSADPRHCLLLHHCDGGQGR